MQRKPKLGQNFLVDEHACLRIAEALGDVSARPVVEIGPGHGAITRLLAPRCAHLDCIEFDPALARELAFKFRDTPHVAIYHADILKTDLCQLAAGDLRQESENQTFAVENRDKRKENGQAETNNQQLTTANKLDVIGNLPYYITSDILLHLFAAARAGALRRAVVMMQREVADRIAAAPGSSEYGALSAFTQLHAQVTNLFTLPPSAFSPPPDVYSTVLRLDFAPRFAELGVEAESFNRFLRAGFAQKRKTLSNNLRNAGYSSEALVRAWPADLPVQARAEAVSLETMAALYRGLATSS